MGKCLYIPPKNHPLEADILIISNSPVNTRQKSKSSPNAHSSGQCGMGTRSKRHTRRLNTTLKRPDNMRKLPSPLDHTHTHTHTRDDQLTKRGVGTMRGNRWRWATCQNYPQQVYAKMKIASTRWSGRKYKSQLIWIGANDKAKIHRAKRRRDV